jgi:ankyrin repeat protein
MDKGVKAITSAGEKALLTGLCAVLVLAQSPSEDLRDTELRTAAAKAVVLLQDVGEKWYRKHSCTSCHNHTLPMMAFARARGHGVAVDERKAALHAKRSLTYLRMSHAIQGSWQGSVQNEESLAFLAAHESGIPPGVTAATYARLVAGKQFPDGHWLSGGNRPPQDYSEITTTARALRMIQLHLPDRMPEKGQRIARARKWLETQNPTATEEQTFRLFGLAWAGANKAVLRMAAARLMTLQQADGGWPQLPGRTSDAYSTGEVLVALHEAARVPPTHPAYRKGILYLLKTQRSDGSWFVKSRILHPAPVSPPYFESGFPYGKDQYISAMATSWAVMALCLALPPATDQSTPPDWRGIFADRLEPWAQTILFGSAAELNALLANGFDANTKDTDGTTALMMAIPDYQKVRLLVDAGADVNARANSRFTPLMVAAAYRGTAKIVRLLLEKGATLETGAPPPIYNASPGFLAVAAADTETMKVLLEKGADITRKMFTFGLFENDAFEWAAFGGDPANVNYLASRKIAPEKLGEALIVSVISNRASQVRELLRAGADVNYADRFGMTPLLYAASIDFGSTDIMQVLLGAGADVKKRTKEGRTAWALAHEFGNVELQKALERSGASE